MKELLIEYKKTRLETQKLLTELQTKYDSLRYSNGRDLISVLTEDDLALLHQLEEDLNIIRTWLSNLNYAIEWIQSGKRPNSKRGIERRAAYEREIPFEPYWIQRQKENSEFSIYESLMSENEEVVANNQELKQRTVSSLTQSLTKRQKEILELAGNDFSHDEIAKMLKVHKGTVSQTINRAKEKIHDEGWFMP